MMNGLIENETIIYFCHNFLHNTLLEMLRFCPDGGDLLDVIDTFLSITKSHKNANVTFMSRPGHSLPCPFCVSVVNHLPRLVLSHDSNTKNGIQPLSTWG